MTTPVISWITPAGRLGTYDSKVRYVMLQLEASTAVRPAVITYTLLSGTLPLGLSLNQNPNSITLPSSTSKDQLQGISIPAGMIYGYPNAVVATAAYEFIIRATVTDSNGVDYHSDRTFSMAINRPPNVYWISQEGRLGTYDALKPMSYRLLADKNNGSVIIFEVSEGRLPDGLSISSDGVISGIPRVVPNSNVSSFTIRIRVYTSNYTSGSNMRPLGEEERSFSIEVNTWSVTDESDLGLFTTGVSVHPVKLLASPGTYRDVSYSITSGKLPEGSLTLTEKSTTGTVISTATSSGTTWVTQSQVNTDYIFIGGHCHTESGDFVIEEVKANGNIRLRGDTSLIRAETILTFTGKDATTAAFIEGIPDPVDSDTISEFTITATKTGGATGGTIRKISGSVYHSFSTSGTFSISQGVDLSNVGYKIKEVGSSFNNIAITDKDRDITGQFTPTLSYPYSITVVPGGSVEITYTENSQQTTQQFTTSGTFVFPLHTDISKTARYTIKGYGSKIRTTDTQIIGENTTAPTFERNFTPELINYNMVVSSGGLVEILYYTNSDFSSEKQTFTNNSRSITQTFTSTGKFLLPPDAIVTKDTPVKYTIGKGSSFNDVINTNNLPLSGEFDTLSPNSYNVTIPVNSQPVSVTYYSREFNLVSNQYTSRGSFVFPSYTDITKVAKSAVKGYGSSLNGITISSSLPTVTGLFDVMYSDEYKVTVAPTGSVELVYEPVVLESSKKFIMTVAKNTSPLWINKPGTIQNSSITQIASSNVTLIANNVSGNTSVSGNTFIENYAKVVGNLAYSNIFNVINVSYFADIVPGAIVSTPNANYITANTTVVSVDNTLRGTDTSPVKEVTLSSNLANLVNLSVDSTLSGNVKKSIIIGDVVSMNNSLQVDSIAGLEVNQVINFSGNTFANVKSNKNYYLVTVGSHANASYIKISETKGGYPVLLSNSSSDRLIESTDVDTNKFTMSSSIDGLRVNQKIEFTLAYGNVLTDSNHTYFISSIEHDEDTLKNTITISDTLSGSIKSLDKILTTTSSSSNAGIVTIGFVTQPLSPYAIGQTVTITGIVSANYAGGTHVVTGCTTSSVSFASNIAVGSQTTPGTIQSKPLNNILTTTSSSSNAGIVTIGFPNQSSSPYVIGQTISITGIVSVNYTGGTHVVTDCTTSSVSFASNIAVGSQTTSGTIHAAGIINSTMSFTIKDFGMKYTVPSFVAANTYYEFKKYDTNRVSLSNAGTLPIVIGQSVTGNLVSPGTILLNLENRRTKTGNVTSTVLSNNTYWVKQDQTDPAFVFLDGNCYTSTDEFKIQDVKLNGNIAITSVNGGNVSNVTPGTMLTFTGLETKNTNSTKKIATLSKPVTIADDHYSFSNPHYDKLNVVNGDFITSNSVVSGTGISDSDTVTVSSVSGNVVTLSKPLTELASGEYTFTISEFKEGDQLNYNFMAKPAVKNDYVTYEIVTGNLPAGNLVLTSSNNSARLTGTLAQVATNAYSEFTIRASEYNGNTVVGISERTFDMTISGPTPPSFITGNGMLSDSNKLSQYANTPSLPIGNIYNSVKGVALKRPFSTTKSTTKIKVVATNFMLTGSKIKFVGPTFGGANVIADQVYYLNSIDSVNNEIEISLTSGGLSIIVDEDPYFVNSANKPEPNSMSFTVTGLNLIIDTTPYNVTNYNIANGTPVFIAGVNGTIQLNNNKFYTGNVDGANNRFNLFNSANLISSSVVTGNGWGNYISGGTIGLISNDSEFFSTQLSVDVADPGATATFTLESGELPYGLELSSTGLISGYPVAKKSVTLTDKSVVYYGAVDVNGNPTTKLSKFQVKATTDSGSAVGNFSIGVVNQEAAWAENNTIPFPGRAPVLLNNKPLSTTISNSDPYYSYYFTGSSLGKFTQDNGFLFKINGYNFNQLNVPSGNTESNLTYSITGLREGNVTETSAFSKLISPTSNNANAVNGWINGTLNYIGADIKTYNFNVNISTPNLSSISTNATFTSNTSNITVSDISELRVSQKILFDSTVSANLMANTLYSISNINGNVIQISTVSTNVNVGTITGNANPTISTSDLLLLTANASFVNNNDNILISNANMTSLKVGQHVVFNANVSSNVTANTQYAIAGINGSNIQIATVPSIVNVGNITGNNHAVMSSTDLVPLSTGNIPLSFIVGGSINSNVGWSDTGDLGIIYNGAISEIVLTAAFSDQITDGRFKIIDGSLPPNLRLLGSGEIAGRVAFQNTSVAQSPNSSTTYTFTVRAYSKQYPEVKSDKTYTLTVVQKYTEPYDNIYVSGLLSTDQRSIVNGMISDIDTNYSSDIYRNGDSYFGLTTGVKYLHMYGVPSITSNDFFSAYNVAIATNHSLKNLTLGALKTAVARDDSGTIIYEVIYSEVIDTLANNGTSINEIVSTTAGTQYPNSLTNMRNQIKSKIGFIDDSSLMPRWMRSQQLDGSVYGYTPCWVICYTKPGKSAEIVNAINTYLTSVEYSLNNINFAMDRLEVDRSMTSTYGTTADYVWPSFTAQLIKDSANIRVNSLSGITMNQPVKLSGNVGSTGYSLGSTYYITAIDNDNSYTTNAIGNIHTTLTSNIVTGYNTKFTKDLQTGQLLLSVSNEKIGIVSMINSDSNLMLTGLAQVGITNISNSAEVGMKFNKEIHANSKTIQLRLNQNSSGNTAIVAADDGNVTLITTPLSAGTDNNSKDSYVMFTGNSTI